MAFGRKKHEADEVPARTGREIRTTALVVNTARPMTKTLGGSDRGRVYVLVENGPEPIYVGSKFRLTPERWLVTGMRVGVWIDPASPEDFAIDWDSIPSIEDRARANDATLADPRAGERAVIDAMRAAGRMGDTESVPEAIRELAARAEVARQTAAPDRFEEAMDRAARLPAAPGRQRAVVLIATTAASINHHDHTDGANAVTTVGEHPAVLAVNVPGRAPYAVYMPRFNRPRHRDDVGHGGIPALVSLTDPDDVEVLWDEMPTIETQLNEQVAGQMQGVESTMAEWMAAGQRNLEALHTPGATEATPPPASAADPLAQMPEDMKAMMVENARVALRMVRDPAQRKMLIEQYRAAGIPIDDS